MASESTAVSSSPVAAGKTEPPAAADRRRSERRIPTARETLATLPELDDVEPVSAPRRQEAEDYDFEPHDTIPAPTWLDDEAPAPVKP